MQRQAFEGGQLEEYQHEGKQQLVFVSKIYTGSLKSQTGASPLSTIRQFMSVLCVIFKSHMNSPSSKVFSITNATGFFSINKEVAFIYTAHKSKEQKLQNVI